MMPYSGGGQLPMKGAPGNAQRNRITQALMNVQNPPPAMRAPMQASMIGTPSTTSAMPGSLPPAATGVPGMGAGMMPGAMPDPMAQQVMPGGAPPLPQPGTPQPGMPPQY